MIELPNFFTQQECLKIIDIINQVKHIYPLGLHDDKYNILDLIKSKLKYPFVLPRYISKITLGYYSKGGYLSRHVDAPYQEGTHSLLIYLNDVKDGGKTIFDRISIKPESGKAIIFDIFEYHEAEKVIQGEKYILACELTTLN